MSEKHTVRAGYSALRVAREMTQREDETIRTFVMRYAERLRQNSDEKTTASAQEKVAASG